MKKLNVSSPMNNLLRGASAMAMMFAASPLYAQETEDSPAAMNSEVEVESGEVVDCAVTPSDASCGSITVTGSRIRRPNLDSNIPITSLSGEQLFQQSSTSIGDTLNELPQLRSTFAQSNPGLGIGIAGLNLLDLRGLGTVRTLVLVNGRRHVGADILNNASSPDVNTIPNDLVERIDVVTGGNSAVYGSDAIAGVVNFILKRDFEGVQVRGHVAGSQKGGFGMSQYVSAMVGQNFADDRANVTLHGEFAHQGRIFGSDVPWLRRQDGFLVTDVDTAGLPFGADGTPDREYFKDLQSASIHRYGLIPITQPGTNPLCGRALISTNGPASTTGGLPINCTYIFTRQGDLISQTGTRVGTSIISSIYGGNGQTGREDKLLPVLPEMTRYNLNLLAHYSVSDAFEPFVEAKYVKINTIGSAAGPSFIQGTFGQFDIRERIRLDNPFLDPAERTAIANAILTSGCNTSLTAACTGSRSTSSTVQGPAPVQGVGGPLNAADRAAITAGTYRFVVARHLADSGIRDEEFDRETFRIVGGTKGTFNDDWGYEISANYGEMKEDTTTYGYVDRQRFLLSLDAGRNPLTGQIQCRAQYDATAAEAYTRGQSAEQIAANQARLASDIAACVPYNPFGETGNQAAANYFVYNAQHQAKMTQFGLLGFVSGDFSQLFELPGGPVSFVVGGEYRKEKAYYEQDQFVEDGFTNAVVIPTFAPPPFKVKEAFAELRLPILKDMPLVEELTVSGAGRLSSYGGEIGTTKTYNAGIEYAPNRDFRFRANYGRAVRAPNVSETGFPQVPNFSPGFTDPCSSSQLANNPGRLPNCQADLGPLLAGLPTSTYSLPIISGSNPLLTEESSKSLTIGGVFQPQSMPGLSLSVDYYKITVDDVIVSLGAQAIANNCYDQASLNNVFCGLFTRYRGTGTGPLGEQPGQILGNSLISAGVNFASRVRKGIDLEAAYRREIGDVRLDTRFLWTHNFKISNYQDPTFPDFENRILGELGDPQDEFRWDISAKKGRVTLGYQMSYIGKMVLNAWEDTRVLPAGCLPTGCPPFNADYASVEEYPSVFYHDVRLDFDMKGMNSLVPNFSMYVGVDNLTNKKPPLGATGTGAGSAIYQVLGRRLFAGFKAKF